MIDRFYFSFKFRQKFRLLRIMKVLKPHWVSHDDMPIFSIDIHPDGSRFVTGGQGDDSGRVVIWNMAPVMSEAKEADETVPKMLCQLDNHLACVNCVRWSYSGKYLASGGDDKLVMVWTFAKSPSGGNPVFGGKGKINMETWRCVSTLRGHQGDVLDMAWSPHDVWLATCSVDNTVIVWDAAKLPEIVAVLKGHTGLVKGVTWDPVGKYLSSQSDDKSLRIWRTVDWQQEAVIKKPFEDCGGTTLVLRLSWSPDGQYLVSAHAMNGSGPTAQIIEREGWKHDIDFVGHRKAVTCVRFSTNILKRYYSCKGKTLQACCCAIGSRDRSISVWVTALERPLFAMEGLFMRPVLDLSWSANGLQLMACSGDGTVAYFEFTEKELGKALSLDEKNALYEKIYGKSLVTSQPTSAMAVENPEMITANKKEVQKEPAVLIVSSAKPVSGTVTTTTSTPTVTTNVSPLTKACTNKQIETRTSDGRRRITPIYIPPTPDTADGPIPFGSESVPFSSSSECKSRIVIERRDVVVTPNVSPAKVILGTVSDTNVISSHMKEDCAGAVEKSIPVKRGTEKTERIPVKRPRFAESKALTETSGGSVKCISKDLNDTASGISLPLPCLPSPATYMISGTHKQVVVENSAYNSPHGPLTHIKMLNNSELKWELLIGSLVCSLALNECVIVAACEDGTIHVLETQTGHHVVPALVLPKPAAKVSVSKPAWVMCVSTSGHVSVWNMITKTVVVSSESIAPVMTAPPGTEITINRCFVSDKGIPMLALSTGKAYMYSVELSSWMLALDVNDPVVRSSQKAYQSALHSVPENGSSPLKMLQTHVHSSLQPESKRMISNFESSPLCTLTFLENQLSACKALYSSHEYHFWLITTVRFLLQEGYENRLRIICDELLGHHPIDSSRERNSISESSVLGISKLTLLKDILAEIGATSNAQRLYLEYKEQLKYALQ